MERKKISQLEKTTILFPRTNELIYLLITEINRTFLGNPKIIKQEIEKLIKNNLGEELNLGRVFGHITENINLTINNNVITLSIEKPTYFSELFFKNLANNPDLLRFLSTEDSLSASATNIRFELHEKYAGEIRALCWQEQKQATIKQFATETPASEKTAPKKKLIIKKKKVVSPQ